MTKSLIDHSFSHKFVGKRDNFVRSSLIDQGFSHIFVGKALSLVRKSEIDHKNQRSITKFCDLTYRGAYVLTTMPLAYAVDARSFSGVRALKMRNPSPIAIGLTKRFNSSISWFSISDRTNVAPP